MFKFSENASKGYFLVKLSAFKNFLSPPYYFLYGS